MNELKKLQTVSWWEKIRLYVASHRTHLNKNLGLLIALIAAAFAGISAWEADKTRKDAHKDAIFSLKIAQRSYVEAENFSAEGSIFLGIPTLWIHRTVKVYGNSPAYQIAVTEVCKIGPVTELLGKKGGITDDDLKDAITQRLPGMIVSGGTSSLDPEMCTLTRKYDYGVITYGVIRYLDIFGDPHYKRFCYYNTSSDPEAMVSQDETKWRKSDVETMKTLRPCGRYDDADTARPE